MIVSMLPWPHRDGLPKSVHPAFVLMLMERGSFFCPTSDRQIEYLPVYGDTVIVADSETAVWGGKCPTPANRSSPLYGYMPAVSG
jgi:hypothetical protein